MDTLFIYLFAIWSVAVSSQNPKGGSSSVSVGIAVRQGEPSSVIAQKSGQLLLNCSVEYTQSLGPLVIAWTRDGLPVDLGTKRVQLLQNGSLYFRRVRHRPKRDQTDAGRYQCLATLKKVGTVVARDVEVKVAGIERRFLLEPQPQTVPLGGVARFQCKIKATPPALYIWERNQMTLPQNDNRFLLLSSGILQITGVRADDAGSYRCYATQGFIHDQAGEVVNIDGKYSAEARLDVDTGASITMTKIVASSQNVTVTVGMSAVLECLVQGSKKSVIWKKENQRLSIQTDGRITLVGNNLRFLETMMDDAGKYQCVADNIISTMSLTIIRKPVLREVQDSQKAPSAQWVYLSCTADGHPKPQITWLKDATPLVFSDKYKRRGDNELVIVQADPSHSGYYQCVASNAGGSTMGIIRVNIIQQVDVPRSVTNLRAENVSKSHIVVTWDLAKASMCCRVLAYTIHYHKVGGELKDTVTPTNRFELMELPPFSEYKFYVVAYSAVGAGPKSEVLTVITKQDVPSKPVVVTLEPHAHSIRVEWEELPEADRNGVITNYKLLYRRADGNADGGNGTDPAPIMTGLVLSHVITGLESNTEYEVRAVARTAVGFSTFSSEKVWPWVSVYTRNENYVVAPEILVVAINVTSVNVTWSYAGEAAVQSFTLTLMVLPGGAVERTIVLQPATRHHILNQLDETTMYKVSLVVEKVDKLTAEVVEEFHMSTVALPPTPRDLMVTLTTSDSVALTWRGIKGTHEIVYFTVRYMMVAVTEQGNVRGTPKTLRSDTTSVLIEELLPFTQYEIAVSAHTDHATSKYSDVILAQTQEGVPSEPQNFKVQVTKPGSVNVRWSPPAMPNGQIKSYVVMYTNTPSQKDDTWVKVTKNGSEDTATIALDGEPADKVYYFKVFASTEKGPGKATIPVSVEPATVPDHLKDGESGEDNKRLGLIIGGAIAATCLVILVIIIIIFLKKRCVRSSRPFAGQPQSQPTHYHGNGHIPGHGNGHTGAIVVGGEHGRTDGGVYEMEAYSPMLPENENSDSKGGGGNMIRNQNGAKLNGFVVPLKKNGVKNLHNGHVTSFMPSQYHTESLESEEHRGLMAAMLGCTTDPCLNENGSVIGEESFTVSGRYEDLGSLDDIDHSSCEGTLGKPQSRIRQQSGCDSSTVDSGEGSLTASDRNSGADTGSIPRSDTTDTGDTVVFCGGPCARPPSPSATLRSPPSSSIEDSGIHVDGVSSSSSVGGVLCGDQNAAVSSGHDALPQLLSSFSSASSPTMNGENFRHGDEATTTMDMETSLPASSPSPHLEHRQELQLPQNQLSTSHYSQARGRPDDNYIVGAPPHSSCGPGHHPAPSPGTALPPVRFANGGPPGRGPSHLSVSPVSPVMLPPSGHQREVYGQTDSGDRYVDENGDIPQRYSAQGQNEQHGQRSHERYRPSPPTLPHSHPSPQQQQRAGETTLLSHGSREGRNLDETFAQLPQDTVSSPMAVKSLNSSKSSPQNHRHYQV